jgi:hypothetical protein
MVLKKLVKDELSGSIAKSFVSQISRFHRIQGSSMFHEATEHVKTELQKLGFKDAITEQFPADGKSKYWTYTSPIGWTVKNAELRLVEPEEKLLCIYEDCPQSLHTFSNATPPKGITAELVDVGAGTKPKDYEGKDVKDKFVLATGRAKLVHDQAVYKCGAAGVITDTITYEMPNVRESLDIPDAHAYQAIWPTAEELPKVTFGFSLSKRQGNALRALLKGGKSVRLHAEVDAKLFAGHAEIITATIPGKIKPQEEIFLVAHLCHPKPSANDNASGSGLLLEIARTIKTLIAQRKISHPARTIRFIWVPETLGTVAYLSKHPELKKRLVAGINLDMVGQNQELCKSTLTLDRTPDSCPSYLNDFVYSLIEQSVDTFDPTTHFGSSSTFRYRTQAFSGGSDHAEFTEPTVHVPCVMLLQWPDLYYHTSEDTIDKVSEDSLKRVGWITTVAALTLANADAETAFQIAMLTTAKAKSRIAQTTTEATDAILKNKDKPEEIAKIIRDSKDKLGHVLWRETEAARSVKRLAKIPTLARIIEQHCQDLTTLAQKETERLKQATEYLAKTQKLKIPKLEEAKAEKEAKRLKPKRRFKGTLSMDTFKKALGEKEYEWYTEVEDKDPEFGKKMAEILNFMNGERSAYEIARHVSAEYTPTNTERILKYLKDLERTQFIAFQ